MGKFLLKFVLNGIVVVPLLLWFTEATFMQSFIAAVILSIVAYLVGDQMILRASNNITACIADAAIAFAYFWIVANFMNWSLTFSEMIALSLLLGVVEYVFHFFIAPERAF